MYAALLIPMFSKSMMDNLSAVPPMIYKDDKKTSLACMTMIGLGAGEILGSLANGKLNDKLGVKIYLWICVVEVSLAFIMLFWYVNTWNWDCTDCVHMDYDLTSAIAVAFCWGLQDSGITNFFLCIAGFQFGGSQLPFSALRFVQALAIGSFALIESQIQTVEQHNIYFACIFAFSLFAWMVFFCCFELRDDKKKSMKVSTEPIEVSAKPLSE